MRKISYFMLMCLVITITAGCADSWKDKSNNQWGEDYIWSISEMAMGVLNSAYSAMPSTPDSYGSNFLDAATDNAVTNLYTSDVYKLTSGNWSSTSNPLANWGSCYTQFQHINTFLEKGLTGKTVYDKENETQDAAYKKRLFGEAHFLRAYYGFQLLQQYGGKTDDGQALGYPIAIHFVTEEEAADIKKIRRNTYEECVQQILDDCNVAMENLPASYSGADIVLGSGNIGLPTSLAAAALMSKVSLYAASPAYQTDEVTVITGMGEFSVVDEQAYKAGWERAAEIADMVIRKDGFGTTFYGIQPTDLADAANTTPSEFLLRKFFNSRAMEGRHFAPYYLGKANTTPSQNLVDAFPMANGYPINEPASGYDPSNPYANRDKRFYLNVYHHGATYGTTGMTVNVIEGGKDSYTYNVNASVSGYYLAKFMSKNENMLDPMEATNSQHYYPILRKAEVFLNFAEAANEAWGPKGKGNGCLYSAYDVIRMIREISGGITDTEYLDKVADEGTDAFRNLIQNERRLELAFENHRWFDMRRCLLPLNEPARGVQVRLENGVLTYDTSVIVAERKFNDIRYYYSPLPYDECIKNPALTNNKGWK